MTCEIWVAVRKGLEPSTSGVTGRHSNQLNYRTRLVAFPVESGCKYRHFFSSCNNAGAIFRKKSLPARPEPHSLHIRGGINNFEGGLEAVRQMRHPVTVNRR